MPLTAEPDLWTQAVKIGSTIIWLHTYGERYVDEQAGRPQGLSALAEGSGPRVLNPIADTSEGMPEEIKYVSETRTLHIGTGTIAPVSSAVWNYDVGGMRIVTKWFDYRSKKPRHKRRSSQLDNINCLRWTPQSTSELLQLITILDQCVKLEPSQARLLTDICSGQLITVDDLTGAGILPPPPSSTKLRLDDPNTPPML